MPPIIFRVMMIAEDLKVADCLTNRLCDDCCRSLPFDYRLLQCRQPHRRAGSTGDAGTQIDKTSLIIARRNNTGRTDGKIPVPTRRLDKARRTSGRRQRNIDATDIFVVSKSRIESTKNKIGDRQATLAAMRAKADLRIE